MVAITNAGAACSGAASSAPPSGGALFVFSLHTCERKHEENDATFPFFCRTAIIAAIPFDA